MASCQKKGEIFGIVAIHELEGKGKIDGIIGITVVFGRPQIDVDKIGKSA